MTGTSPSSRKFQKELNAGTSALVLLTLLGRSSKPMYGYEITKLFGGAGGSPTMMKQGALYPVLRSLEAKGLLTSSVKPSASGPPRKYYRITTEGRTALDEWREIWTETRKFVDSMLKETDND
jgi:PadR family transcriptional regulator PadR